MTDVTANANPSNIAAVTGPVKDNGEGGKVFLPANQVEFTNNGPIATALTSASPFGFATADQGDDLVTTVNQIRAGLIALGLFKDATANSD
jgi:hypothetical protein